MRGVFLGLLLSTASGDVGSEDFSFTAVHQGLYCSDVCRAVDEAPKMSKEELIDFYHRCEESMHGKFQGSCDVHSLGIAALGNCWGDPELLYVPKWPFDGAQAHQLYFPDGLDRCVVHEGRIDVEFLNGAESCDKIAEPIGTANLRFANKRIYMPTQGDPALDMARRAQAFRVKCNNLGMEPARLWLTETRRFGDGLVKPQTRVLLSSAEGRCHTGCFTDELMTEADWIKVQSKCEELHPPHEGMCTLHGRMASVVPVCDGSLAGAAPIDRVTAAAIYAGVFTNATINCSTGFHHANLYKTDGTCGSLKPENLVGSWPVWVEDDTVRMGDLDGLVNEHLRASGFSIADCPLNLNAPAEVDINMLIVREFGSGVVETGFVGELKCEGDSCPTECTFGPIKGREETIARYEACKSAPVEGKIELELEIEEEAPVCVSKGVLVHIEKPEFLVNALVTLESVEFHQDITECYPTPNNPHVVASMYDGRAHCGDVVDTVPQFAEALIEDTKVTIVNPVMGLLTATLADCHIDLEPGTAHVVYRAKEFIVPGI